MTRQEMTVCEQKNLELLKHPKVSCIYFNNQECKGCKYISQLEHEREVERNLQVLDDDYNY